MSTENNAGPQEQGAGAPDKAVTEAVSRLSSVNENAPEAKKNAYSISDNRGGRIELGEKLDTTKNVIRGVEKLSNAIQGVED